MTANNSKSVEPSPFVRPLTMWEVHAENVEKEAQDIQSLRQEMLDMPRHVAASELDGETFYIVALKPFESSYVGQDHAYFAGCVDTKGDKFTTVLGGMIIVETLDALIDAGLDKPVKVTLIEKKQGKYGRYYVLE